MIASEHLTGVARARSASARTLLAALKRLDGTFSELTLANEWKERLRQESDVLPFGWYRPPPSGMSVLVGNPPGFGRLRYESLRSEGNWPGNAPFARERSIIYPYFSAIDRATLMIGDQVGTYYGGVDRTIREWICETYRSTVRIIERIQVGMAFAEVFTIGVEETRRLGARNNTFSLRGGYASDIGHSVPFFGMRMPPVRRTIDRRDDLDRIAEKIAAGREFIGPASDCVVTHSCAFTIEPQMLVDGMPMASFHMIVAFVDERKVVIDEFKDLFAYFGMTDWMGSAAH